MSVAAKFDIELWEVDAKTSLYLALDKFRSVEARTLLAAAVVAFLRATAGDVVVTYLDVLVLRRMRGQRVCATGRENMIPPDAELPQPD